MTPIPGTEGAESAFFSPDGEWIGFIADGAIKKRHLGRGPTQTVCAVTGISGQANWGEDGIIRFGSGTRLGLMRVSAAGGQPEVLTTPDYAAGEYGHNDPWSEELKRLVPTED